MRMSYVVAHGYSTERLYFFEWYKNLGDAVKLVADWKAAPYFKFGHKGNYHIPFFQPSISNCYMDVIYSE
jgi:hypothetical protein